MMLIYVNSELDKIKFDDVKINHTIGSEIREDLFNRGVKIFSLNKNIENPLRKVLEIVQNPIEIGKEEIKVFLLNIALLFECYNKYMCNLDTETLQYITKKVFESLGLDWELSLVARDFGKAPYIIGTLSDKRILLTTDYICKKF